MTTPQQTNTAPKKSPSGGTGDYPRYAVTWFFRVVVEGTPYKDLGNWQSCNGLDITFKADAVQRLAVYDEHLYSPGDITYGPITLERAMDKKNSTVLRQWIKEVTDEWVNSDGRGEPYAGHNVTITLFDNIDQEVMSWTLRNAILTKWVGPSLSSSGSNVAIEKITLTHQGFL